MLSFINVSVCFRALVYLKNPNYNFLHLQDSLAAEIEGTMRKELQMDDPDIEEQRYIKL